MGEREVLARVWSANDMAVVWVVELFGGLRAVGGGREITRFRTRKTGALLGFLCLHAERLHAREALAEVLWPGCDPDDGLHSLSTALWSLRRQLDLPDRPAAPVLLADRLAVGINQEVVETDVARFHLALRRAGGATSERERAAALGRAVELYRGEVLAGYYEEWLESCRRELRESHRRALQELIACLRSTGQRALALHHLGRAAQVDPEADLRPLFAELAAEPPAPPPPTALASVAERPLPEGTATFLLAGGATDRTALQAVEIHRHQGHLVESGDPLVAVFDCAEDALACAAALHAVGPPELRVALETGRATPEGGRYFDPALDHAARLLLATGAGQTLCSERTASLARLGLDPGLALIELGSYQLPGGAGAERLFQLASAASAAPPRPPLGLAPASGSLPRPLTRFFGREGELAELSARLTAEESRLVTLWGPGGCGKTRLALEVGNRLAASFGGTVWFLPLTELSAPELVLPALLRELGIEERQAAAPVRQLARRLGRRPALIVVDNAEHLLPDCARALAELVAACPALRCLVTSRARLGVPGEAVVALSPLPLPPTGPAAAVATCASVGLFVDRAQGVVPDFQISDANAGDIARLCVRLEGLPLALELAAAKIATLTPAQLLARLDERLELVASPRDHRPERHHSLRLALGGSVEQLSGAARRLLLRLAVFRGGWELGAAEAVGDEPLAADHLADLVDLSLVSVEVAPGRRRFRLLESLREALWEQLEPVERRTVEQRHAEFYQALGQEASGGLGGAADAEWFARLDRELPNFRAALEWLLAHRPVAAAEVVCALAHYFDVHGAWSEGLRWTERAAAALPAERDDLRSRLGRARGWLCWLLGDIPSAVRLTAAWITYCRGSGHAGDLCGALYQGAIIDRSRGRRDQARAQLEEAAELARRRSGGSPGLPALLQQLATDARERGEPRRALALLDEAEAAGRGRTGRRSLANLLYLRAEVAADLADLDGAQRLHEQAYAIFQEVGDRRALANYRMVYGYLARRRGDPVEAERQFRAGLVESRELGHLQGIASANLGLGRLAADGGDAPVARLYLAECLRLYHQVGSRTGLSAGLEVLAETETEVDPAAAVRALAGSARLGSETSPDQLSALRERLGEAAYAAAWEAGWQAAECYLDVDESE